MADTLEDSLVVSYKTKNTLTIRSSNHSPLKADFWLNCAYTRDLENDYQVEG